MSWVPLISDEQASPEVKRIYDYIRERWSFVPNYFRALGHDAQLLEDQTNLYTNAMFDERGLPRVVKEQLPIVVSGLSVSTYCLPAHLEILGRLGMDKAIGRKLALDYPSAPVEPKLMELFRFADKLTRSPGEMEKASPRASARGGFSNSWVCPMPSHPSVNSVGGRLSPRLKGLESGRLKTSARYVLRLPARYLKREPRARVKIACT